MSVISKTIKIEEKKQIFELLSKKNKCSYFKVIDNKNLLDFVVAYEREFPLYL